MKFRNKRFISGGFILAILAVITPGTASYLSLSFGLDSAWIALAPLIIYIKQQGKHSYRYLIPSILSMVGYLAAPTPFFILLAGAFAILFVLERFHGKVNFLAPLLILLVTPLSQYFFNVFGFPIRLHLTQLASFILNGCGLMCSTSGNIISTGEKEFAVDPECMGLKMVVSSFLISFLLISWFERKYRKSLTKSRIVFLLIINTVLIILANLIRIVLLVVFDSAPETASHEIIGLVSLLSFVMIPEYFLIKNAIIRYGIPRKRSSLIRSKPINTATVAPLMILLVVLGILSIHASGLKHDIPGDPLAQQINIAGYDKDILPNNVIRFTHDDKLIYIKPNKGIFRSEHHPMTCWKGSGYHFQNERQITVGETKVYTAKLVSGQQSLYTAWWYDNGLTKVTGQLDWRWQMLKGAPEFRLINITCTSFEALLFETNQLLNREIIPSN